MNQTPDEAARIEDAALTRAAQAGEVTALGLLLEPTPSRSTESCSAITSTARVRCASRTPADRASSGSTCACPRWSGT